MRLRAVVPAWPHGLGLAPLVALLVALAPSWAGATSSAGASGAAQSAVGLPLSTSGRRIVDPGGRRVRLAAVNWAGASTPAFVVAGLDHARLSTIVSLIKQGGFNAVRIPISNQMWETNPVVNPQYLSANPALEPHPHARDVLDAVIKALGNDGLMVILDDHVTDAATCCKPHDRNGLWYGPRWDGGRFTEHEWISDWQRIASHYAGDRWVVGAELRNELRPGPGGSPYWGDPRPTDCSPSMSSRYRNDWPMAAACAGDAVLSVNRKLLVIVDGLNLATDLSRVRNNPVRLIEADKLVYSAHNYEWDDKGLTTKVNSAGSYSAFKRNLDPSWGYIVTPDRSYTAPVWVSEFGTCLASPSGTCPTWRDQMYFAYIRRYIGDASLDWAYWPLNGTQMNGRYDTYGLLNTSWTDWKSATALADLRQLEAPSTICTFAHTCSRAPLEKTPGGTRIVQLPSTEGLYVKCYRAGPNYDGTGDSRWLHINWTSSYHSRYAGYVPDALVNTYHANLAYYWRHC